MAMRLMLSETQIDDAVSELQRAEETGVVSELASLPPFEPADGYAIQRAWICARVSAGTRATGWKIGATSPESLVALGASEPMFAPLPGDTEVRSGASCLRAALIQPMCEAEVAFRIASEIAAGDLSAEHVLDATNALAPAIEVIDCRLAPSLRGAQYAIADRGRAARFVLGDWVAPGRVGNTADIGVTVHLGDQTVATGHSRRVMGDPALAVAWLARRLAADGIGLKAGDVVLSGTLIAPVAVGLGDTVHADFDSSLGSVAVSFV